MNITIDEKEHIIIKSIFTNQRIRDKIIPYLRFSLFDDVNAIELLKFVRAFMDKHNKFPTQKETKLTIKRADVYAYLLEAMKVDISEYADTVILDIVKEYIREKIIMNSCFSIAEEMTNGNIDGVYKHHEDMREGIAFTFDDNLGLDLFSEEAEERMYIHFTSKENAVSTGLQSVDELIEDGFHEKTLNIFMAETNLGKSLIMGACGHNNLLEGKVVAFITCEMSENKIGARILANNFDIPTKDIKCLTRSKFSEVYKRAIEKMRGKLYIKEYPTGSATVSTIRNYVKEIKLKDKVVPDIIYVDYIGIMATDYKTKSDNTYTTQKKIAEELRGLACELGIPIVSAIQVNRSGLAKEKLELSSASDSLGPAFTADVVIGVTQPEDLKMLSKYRWTILKNRYGSKDIDVLIDVNYANMRLTVEENYVPPTESEKDELAVMKSEFIEESIPKVDNTPKVIIDNSTTAVPIRKKTTKGVVSVIENGRKTRINV